MPIRLRQERLLAICLESPISKVPWVEPGVIPEIVQQIFFQLPNCQEALRPAPAVPTCPVTWCWELLHWVQQWSRCTVALETALRPCGTGGAGPCQIHGSMVMWDQDGPRQKGMDCHCQVKINTYGITIWSFNIAMENPL